MGLFHCSTDCQTTQAVGVGALLVPEEGIIMKARLGVTVLLAILLVTLLSSVAQGEKAVSSL